MRTAVIIPWRTSGEPAREQSFYLVTRQWRLEHRDYHLILADDGLFPFARSGSINRAVANLPAEIDVLVIADADVLVPAPQIKAAVAAARDAPGKVAAFDRYMPLDQRSTQLVWGRGGIPPNFETKPVASWTCVSGCFAISRKSFNAVGGFDERFRGWGREDSVLDIKVHYDVAPRRSIQGPAWHLAHPVDRIAPVQNDTLWRQIQLHYEPWIADMNVPKILHRVVPQRTTDLVEDTWAHWQDLHPDWAFRTWRDPIDPSAFPLTRHLWSRAVAGAQLAGFVRLEALLNEGGVYCDSDLVAVRPIDRLVANPGLAYACRESEETIPDAWLAAPPNHAAIRTCIEKVLALPDTILFGSDRAPFDTGPAITTEVFGSGRPDTFVYPSIVAYPVHWSKKQEIVAFKPTAETYMIHGWRASWAGAIGHTPVE